MTVRVPLAAEDANRLIQDQGFSQLRLYKEPLVQPVRPRSRASAPVDPEPLISTRRGPKASTLPLEGSMQVRSAGADMRPADMEVRRQRVSSLRGKDMLQAAAAAAMSRARTPHHYNVHAQQQQQQQQQQQARPEIQLQQAIAREPPLQQHLPPPPVLSHPSSSPPPPPPVSPPGSNHLHKQQLQEEEQQQQQQQQQQQHAKVEASTPPAPFSSPTSPFTPLQFNPSSPSQQQQQQQGSSAPSSIPQPSLTARLVSYAQSLLATFLPRPSIAETQSFPVSKPPSTHPSNLEIRPATSHGNHQLHVRGPASKPHQDVKRQQQQQHQTYRLPALDMLQPIHSHLPYLPPLLAVAGPGNAASSSRYAGCFVIFKSIGCEVCCHSCCSILCSITAGRCRPTSLLAVNLGRYCS